MNVPSYRISIPTGRPTGGTSIAAHQDPRGRPQAIQEEAMEKTGE